MVVGNHEDALIHLIDRLQRFDGINLADMSMADDQSMLSNQSKSEPPNKIVCNSSNASIK